MDILVYRWDIFPYDDIITTLKEKGHHTDVLDCPIRNHLCDETFSLLLSQKLREKKYDLTFSVNYYAVMAKVCEHFHVPYAAWTCDTPLLSLLDDSVLSPNNYIFCFDRVQQKNLKARKVEHACYLPLCARKKENLIPATRYEVSFVGSLYDKNQYDRIYDYLPPYLRGYIDAAIAAQELVCGGNLFYPLLTRDILTKLKPFVRVENGSGSAEELEAHFATQVLAYKTAANVRADALNSLASHCRVDLFTTDDGSVLNGVNCHPYVPYQTKMPQVFADTKINLNFTIPNIENGIPLRVFDVLSAGGFLLTDYRPEIARWFKDGVDLVVVDGLSDLNRKVDYYLNHEKERKKIAENGQKKVRALHSYDRRLDEMFAYIFDGKPTPYDLSVWQNPSVFC